MSRLDKLIESEIPDSALHGDCYVKSYKYMNNHASNKDLRLVHGLVSGQGVSKRYNI